MTAHAAIVLVTALFLKMDIVPSQTTIFGIEAHTLDMSGRGAIFEVQGQIINGQGYYYLLIMFRALASLSIWYALFTAKNEYKYPKFNRIRIIWLFSMGSYFITQCLELSIIFLNSESEIMYLIIRIFSILAMISLLFITFFMPEGLILTKSQIFRVAQLLKEQDIDIQNGKRGIFYTPNEYIEFLNNHFTDE